MKEQTWAKLHESVIVGYFCQAVGWVACATSRSEEKDSHKRYMEALNLSHNPFDPAVGDLLLQLEDTKLFPKEYFIFELKVDWLEGVAQEQSKFQKKSAPVGGEVPPFDRDRALMLSGIEKASTAHLYGAITSFSTSHPLKMLGVASYWDAVLERETKKKPLVSLLLNIVDGKVPGTGFTLEELDAYLRMLNKNAGQGTRAATGSVLFVYAVNEYKQYLLDERQVQKIIERARQLEQQLDQQAVPTPPQPRPRSGMGGRG
ncbi:hypothetical protein [uncultured Piscinibacter sp.]|uniref:hypothetical protein n=1 Tax=uncultured Piscinibacter sp. TaxID=1131835 RepID=UPI0026069ADF|nr:hypothetical protein [uncultured Piscinibacter sp.]